MHWKKRLSDLLDKKRKGRGVGKRASMLNSRFENSPAKERSRSREKKKIVLGRSLEKVGLHICGPKSGNQKKPFGIDAKPRRRSKRGGGGKKRKLNSKIGRGKSGK